MLALILLRNTHSRGRYMSTKHDGLLEALNGPAGSMLEARKS